MCVISYNGHCAMYYPGKKFVPLRFINPLCMTFHYPLNMFCLNSVILNGVESYSLTVWWVVFIPCTGHITGGAYFRHIATYPTTNAQCISMDTTISRYLKVLIINAQKHNCTRVEACKQGSRQHWAWRLAQYARHGHCLSVWARKSMPAL